MIEKSRGSWDIDNTLKRLPPLLLAAGLLIAPAAPAESAGRGNGRSGVQAGQEHGSARELLKNDAGGVKLLDIEKDVRMAMKNIREKAAECKEKIPEVSLDTLREHSSRVENLLEREAALIRVIDLLALAGKGRPRRNALEILRYRNLPVATPEEYSRLQSTGGSLLSDMQAYLRLIENDKEVQKAIKNIFLMSGCLAN